MQDQGLLIAALVAIVAVVGLVILFSGAATTGAANVKFTGTPNPPGVGPCGCPDGYEPYYVTQNARLATCSCKQILSY